MSNLSTPEESQPINAEIPIVRRDQMSVIKHLGSGLSGEVSVIRITGKPEPEVLKVPKDYRGRFDVANEAKIMAYLMRQQPPILGMVKLVGISPNMQTDPYLIKEYLSKGNVFRSNPDDPAHPERFMPVNLIKNGGRISELRAKWAWSLLNNVVAPIHRAGVVIADFKPEDYILTHQFLPDGSIQSVTKCIDFSNSHIEGDETSPSQTSKTSDVLIFFNAILETGFNLPGCPKTGFEHEWTKWLSNIEQRNPDPLLLAVCHKISEKGKYGIPGTGIKDGQELRDLFKPIFEKLGVIESSVTAGLKRLHSELDNDNTLARMVRMDPGNFQSRVKEYIDKNFPSMFQSDKESLFSTYLDQSFSNIYTAARANRIFSGQSDPESWMDQIGKYINSTRNRQGNISSKLGRVAPVYTSWFGDLDPDSEWGKKALSASFQRTKELLLFGQIQQFEKYAPAQIQPIIEQAKIESRKRSNLFNFNLVQLAQAYKDTLVPPSQPPSNLEFSIPPSRPSNLPQTPTKSGFFKKLLG